MTESLKTRIMALIQAQGPISVAQYMTLALHDPQSGYYATHDPIGAAGDFITAPEISQMFGEMLGLWLAQVWEDQGRPSHPLLVELGPGRGTLMADMLRALRAAPDFLQALEVTLVEASPGLTEVQRQKLKDAGVPVRWTHQFDAEAGPGRPLFVVANEFFDALPVRQYVKTPRGWCERMVAIRDDALAFVLAPTPAPSALIPESRSNAPDGGVYETAPAALALTEEIARQVSARGGAALFPDYGYGASAGFGETLQAVGGHAFTDVLARPGQDDLSAHVDFAALSEAARRGGIGVHGPIGQGAFLKALGIEMRAAALARANPAAALQLGHDLERLTAADKMGRLFQVLALLPAAATLAPGFA